jgi:hypothetical protein
MSLEFAFERLQFGLGGLGDSVGTPDFIRERGIGDIVKAGGLRDAWVAMIEAPGSVVARAGAGAPSLTGPTVSSTINSGNGRNCCGW